MASPDWIHWLSVSTLTLEDCVSISMNLQPEVKRLISYTESGTSIRWESSVDLLDGRDRLYLARKYSGSDSEWLPAQVEPGKTGRRVLLIDFVRFADAQNWPMPPALTRLLTTAAVVAEPLAMRRDAPPDLGGVDAAPAAHAEPAPVVHKVKRRTDQLDAVIRMAGERAADAGDWTSVWGALVVLAQRTDRPAPLLGYTEVEGVKYQTDDAEPVAWLTREALRKRMQRNKAGRERTRTDASAR